jgi:hypothetical protein
MQVRTYNIDNVNSTGIHTVDLTLAELKTLRVIQPSPVGSNLRSQAFDGFLPVMTFEECATMAKVGMFLRYQSYSVWVHTADTDTGHRKVGQCLVWATLCTPTCLPDVLLRQVIGCTATAVVPLVSARLQAYLVSWSLPFHTLRCPPAVPEL